MPIRLTAAILLACAAPAHAQSHPPIIAYRDLSGAYRPVAPDAPLPTQALGKQEVLSLATGNVAAAGQSAFGGRYVFAQQCASYGSVALQVLGPDGATWATLLTRTAADTDGGAMVDLGSTARVRVALTGTAGCFATLMRVPA